MNNIRRKLIKMELEKIETILSNLEYIKDDEEDAFDNMPESLQCSERGETSQDAIDSLDNAISSLEDALEELQGID